jgi:L-seryl-tRNA(Ser) seleniumtransferase
LERRLDFDGASAQTKQSMKSIAKSELLRQLPSVDELLRSAELTSLIGREGRTAVTDAAREVLVRLRQEISSGILDAERLPLALSNMAEAIERQLRSELKYSLVSVINATGVVLHTNLGRAPLGASAIEHLVEVATQYSNLEFDIDAGQRGKRDVHAQRLLEKIFASVRAEATSTVVVNNNAAAVLLVLNALAEGGEVIVSRGELVEIGGSFRIPDVMSKSGAMLREVGTTNRTRIADYEQAINERTKMLLRVHRSNFEIVGFTEQPTLEQLVALGRKYNIPVVEDQGSGALVELAEFGIGSEGNVFDSLRAGVDVVTYSGDKMLGGPQAGLLTGRADLIATICRNPLFRALRVDKLTYAMLEATLLAYVKKDFAAIPALAMLQAPTEDVAARAELLVERAKQEAPSVTCTVVKTKSLVGGGSAPGSTLPSHAVAVEIGGMSCDELSQALRRHEPAIIARVEDGRVLLDMRTVFPGQVETMAIALAKVSS